MSTVGPWKWEPSEYHVGFTAVKGEVQLDVEPMGKEWHWSAQDDEGEAGKKVGFVGGHDVSFVSAKAQAERAALLLLGLQVPVMVSSIPEDELRREWARKAIDAAIGEALNSGDGSYRP